eukprot:367853-Rhodomonas_salina.5
MPGTDIACRTRRQIPLACTRETCRTQTAFPRTKTVGSTIGQVRAPQRIRRTRQGRTIGRVSAGRCIAHA